MIWDPAADRASWYDAESRCVSGRLRQWTARVSDAGYVGAARKDVEREAVLLPGCQPALLARSGLMIVDSSITR
jgi:hypothetical protein